MSASWDILFPLEVSALVTHRLPESVLRIRTLSGLPRSASGGDTVALDASLLWGERCLQWTLDAIHSHMPQHARISPFEHLN